MYEFAVSVCRRRHRRRRLRRPVLSSIYSRPSIGKCVCIMRMRRILESFICWVCRLINSVPLIRNANLVRRQTTHACVSIKCRWILSVRPGQLSRLTLQSTISRSFSPLFPLIVFSFPRVVFSPRLHSHGARIRCRHIQWNNEIFSTQFQFSLAWFYYYLRSVREKRQRSSSSLCFAN